jgi:hypothetical protein
VLSGVGVAGAATSVKPAPSSPPTALSAHVVKPKTVHFKGTYKGTIAMLWSASSVKATSVKGTGPSTLMGASAVSGTGTATTSATCDPFSALGAITGGGSRLNVKVVSSTASKACAAGYTPPTNITVTGVVKVISGTGKYKGAKGNLKLTGSFAIQSNTAGSSETDSFTATLSGPLSIKK